MVKQVIKFLNGDYWYHYSGRGPDLQKAWTFNRPEGALNTIKTNGLTDCRILPVEVHFEPTYFIKEIA